MLQVSYAVIAQNEWTLEDLMQLLSEVNQFQASFEEIKDFSIFTDAVTVTGSLRYSKPNYLERQVESPHRELTIIEDDIIRVQRERTGENDEAREMRHSIDIHPAVRTLIESIRATFAGDLVVLEKYYQLEFDGNKNDWQLTLQPLQESVREFVIEVVIIGSGQEINKIITIETDESESEITILETTFS